MRFSEAWLRTWVDLPITTQELADQLTMAGLEVDAVESVAGVFSGVVVGEILSVEAHPDAKKLRICQVKGNGDAPVQVVCGAPNARKGLRVPFAQVGAKLPGDFKIKKAKLRGVESFGMLCGQTELEAGDDDSGLWELDESARVGECLREYLNLDDRIIEVDLTPNRADCLSIKGLAREAAVLNNVAVNNVVENIQPAVTLTDTLPVEIQDIKACPLYMGRVLRDVNLSASSPAWLKERLERSDIRPIDPVVDVTNYILLEMGQPMHAFDLEKVASGLCIRQSIAGESLVFLDGQSREIQSESLVIADNKGVVALAGIMGGERTAVSNDTAHVFLEAAFFEPIAIAGRAREHGLHTDSSHRFERGVDYGSTSLAIERATQLLLDIVGGEAGPLVTHGGGDSLPESRTIHLRKDKISSYLGFDVADERVVEIMSRLGLEVVQASTQGWQYNVPSYRFDLAIEADLIEELARVVGYNNLPTSAVRISAKLPVKSENTMSDAFVKHYFVSKGYREVITYSFISPELNRVLGSAEAVPLLNPISEDLSVMRTSLIPGLVKTLLSNIKRQQSSVRLFETGLTFIPQAGSGKLPVQESKIGGLLYGNVSPSSWASVSASVDFFDLKGDLEQLLASSCGDLEFKKAQHPSLHPGQCADVLLDGKSIGVIGALHPMHAKSLGVIQPAYVFELSFDAIKRRHLPAFHPVGKYPSVSRDLAVVVDRAVPANTLLDEIKVRGASLLKKASIFDVYTGDGVSEHQKSVAFNLTFQDPSRTLKDEDINLSVSEIVKGLEEKLGACLR